jgi:hypothetical protein
MSVWALKKQTIYRKEFGKEYPRGRKAIIPFILWGNTTIYYPKNTQDLLRSWLDLKIVVDCINYGVIILERFIYCFDERNKSTVELD